MSIIIWIIIILLILGALITFFQWAMEHIVQILLVAIIVVGLIFWPKGTVITAGIVILGLGGSFSIYRIGKMFLEYLIQAKERRERIKRERAEEKEKRKHAIEKRKQEEEHRNKVLAEKNTKFRRLPSESRIIVSTCECYIDEVSKIRENVASEEMKASIAEFEKTISDLIESVIDIPEKIPKLQKVVSYYLPTICKLLSSYLVYEKSNDTKAIEITRDIKQTVTLLDEALENLITELRTSSDWDIQSDVSVMKKMLVIDGMISNSSAYGMIEKDDR